VILTQYKRVRITLAVVCTYGAFLMEFCGGKTNGRLVVVVGGFSTYARYHFTAALLLSFRD
jgi:hypothetical protein